MVLHRGSQCTLDGFVRAPFAEPRLTKFMQLSHSTTWKDLKAFTEQACEVDHAEVYPPTSGFVRVRGLANFEKAFSKLDTLP